MSITVHATSVLYDGQAIILMGPPGSGKSDLALRMMMDHGAQLIADDQTIIERVGREYPYLMASVPETIRGMMEIRPLGIRRVPCVDHGRIALAVHLVGAEVSLPRIAEEEVVTWHDISVPLITLHAFQASTPAKIVAFLKYPAVG